MYQTTLSLIRSNQMRVKITFTNGTTMFGSLTADSGSIGSVMNDENKFVPFIQPNGREVMLSKYAIAYINEEVDDYYVQIQRENSSWDVKFETF